VARKKRPTIRLRVVVKDSIDGSEHRDELVSTPEERSARGREEAVLDASWRAQVRLRVVRETIKDILEDRTDAECARRIGVVNAALVRRGLKPYLSRDALAKAVSRIRQS
jgi:hypothetical protein